MEKRNIEVEISQYTNRGQKEINQDFHEIHIPKEPLLTTKGIAIAIADGISSSSVSGEASKTAVLSFLGDYFSTHESWSVKRSAEKIIKATNSWLYSQTRNSQYRYDREKGYVSTFSAMILRSTTAHIFHVGDTRIYRVRDRELDQLTEDHRVWVSREESYLSRALGADSQVTIDYRSHQVENGDIFLFMSDGVYEFINFKDAIIKIESSGDYFSDIAEEIVRDAFHNGSGDNLTLQIVRVTALPDMDSGERLRQSTEKPFPPILEARQEFDGYTIIRELSGTSRSHIYLAKDQELDREVVIKTPSIDLQNDKAYLERFLMEEWIAKRVNSPHVLKACNQTRNRDYLYSVMEFIDGQTLSQWMVDNPNPPLETVRNIAEQIGKGLQAFHRREMVHQDLRPENILIDKSGTVKIIDFGSTRVEGIADINTLIEQENLLGTAYYSAPEYFLGEVGTARSDIFSLALIVYQLFSGKSPYGVEVAKSRTKSAQKRLKYKPLYPKVPIWIDETLRKGSEIEPFKRYGEISEFLQDLRKPNPKYLDVTKPPLLERNPEAFWRGTSFVLAIVIVALILEIASGH
jgi:serine/threonine protein phosphatase PrpC/predicted Ser/Thr protein kinase